MLLLVMAAARLAAVVLVFVAAALTAQNTSRGSVVITVIDQSGAVIPGAHVGIIRLPNVKQDNGDWLNYWLHTSEETSAHTDANGKATVVLAKGRYIITVTHSGFARYFKRIEIRDESSQSLRAALAQIIICPCVHRSPEIPLEHPSLNTLIPFEWIETINLNSGR